MITKTKSGQFGTSAYVFDTAAELSQLPVKDNIGSVALCIEDSTQYVLSGDKEWKEVDVNLYDWFI